MKKLFLLAAASVFIPLCGVFAQGVVVQEPHLMVSNSAIIRECVYPTTVTCDNTRDGFPVFIYSTDSMMTSEVAFKEKGYVVNDMAVTNDSVFFCGQKDEAYAFFGYFRIPSVFYGSGSIYVQNMLESVHGNYIQNLTRLDIYLDSNGRRHLFCVGKDKRGNPCIVDKNDFQSGNYDVGYVTDSKETFTDVKVVRDSLGEPLLVTVGYDSTYDKYINIRLYYPNNIFDPAGPQNKRFLMHSDPSGVRPWKGTTVLLTPVKKNLFATLSLRKKPASDSDAPESQNLHVAYFKPTRLMNMNLYAMVGSIEMPTNDFYTNRNLHRIVSKYDGFTVAFLYSSSTQLITSWSSSFYEIDFDEVGPVWSMRHYTNPSNLMQGLGTYRGAEQYVMSGSAGYSSATLKYETKTFGNTETCSEEIFEKPTVVPNVSAAMFIKEIISTTREASDDDLNPDRMAFTLYIDCFMDEE